MTESEYSVQNHEGYNHLTTNNSIQDMVDHPAFEGFGELLLPRDDNAYDGDMLLNKVGSLMPFHSHVNPNSVVGAINTMIDDVNDGNTVFYSFYTEEQ